MSSSTSNNKEILATIDQYETNCKVSRKNLGTQTKAFKKYNNEEKLNKFPALLKLYQKEIDVLTKRAKYSEEHFNTLANKQNNEKPSSSSSNNNNNSISEESKDKLLIPWKRKVTKLEITNKRLEQEIKEVEGELMNLKNQDITIRQLENKIEELESGADSNIQMQVITHKEKMEEILDRERDEFQEQIQEFLAKIEKAKEGEARAREEQDAAQTELFALRSRVDEEQAVNQSDMTMLSDELDNANNRIQMLEHKLNAMAAKNGSSNSSSSSSSSISRTSRNTKDTLAVQLRLQAELTAKDEIIDHLNQKIDGGRYRSNTDIAAVFNTAVELKLAKDLKAVFKVLDQDHNGSISMKELELGLKKMHVDMNGIEIKFLWDALNVNHGDSISYSEFEQFCKSKAFISKDLNYNSNNNNNNNNNNKNYDDDMVNKLNIELLELKNELNKRPSNDIYMETKSKLRTLQLILYNSIEENDEDEIMVANNGHNNNNKQISDLESIMVKKYHSMESKLTKYKNDIRDLETKFKVEQNLLNKFKNDCEEKQKLIDQLEEDLANRDTLSGASPNTSYVDDNNDESNARRNIFGNNNNNNNNNSNNNSPPSSFTNNSTSSLLQKIVDDAPATPTILLQTNTTSNNQLAASMEDILRGQRDRYRKRVIELESRVSKSTQLLQSSRTSAEQLRADNVKLYEKIKYLQSYDRRKSSKEQLTGRTSSRNNMALLSNNNKRDDLMESGSMSQYKKIYEQSVNPFTQFHKREQNKRFEKLHSVDKIILIGGRFFMKNRYSRAFLFFYFLFLHFVLFLTMYNWTHAHHTFHIVRNIPHHNLPHSMEKIVHK